MVRALARAAHGLVPEVGIAPEHLRLRPHAADELSHYSTAAFDVDSSFRSAGPSSRGCQPRHFDLSQHSEHSGQGQSWTRRPVSATSRRGRDRGRRRPHHARAALDAYTEDEVGGEQRVVLRLSPNIAPIKVAVLPLLKRPACRRRTADLRSRFRMLADTSPAAIGKRYRRHDEWVRRWRHRRRRVRGGPHRDLPRARHAEQQRIPASVARGRLERRLG